MKIAKYLTTLFLTIAVSSTLGGCGKDADETKSTDDIKTEAAKMDVDQLRAQAEKYKNLILAKQDEIAKISEKIKQIPVTEALGEEAKQFKDELEQLNKSLKDLKTRFQLYYDKLKEKNGDLSGLEI